MRVLVFHGYLLQGTGSNVYNAALAAAFVRAGHEVHLLCQDRAPLALDWVDAAGNWDSGRLELEVRREPPRATVYRPDIGGLLPVYVRDRYDGVEARPYPELSDAELEDYVARNAAAVAEVAQRARADVALANHLVLGPLVLARALAGSGIPYAVKVHGSDLEYTVGPYPERFVPLARAGTDPAGGVLVGSRHTAERLWRVLDDPALPARTRLGPPGVDVERFTPLPRAQAAAGLEALRERLARESPASVAGADTAGGGDGGASAPGGGADTTGGGDAGAPVIGHGTDAADDSEADAPAPASSFSRDAGEAARGLAEIDTERDRVVVFVGKLIAAKGVDLLLAAWPLVLERVPDARLVIVGFGGFRAALERLLDALAAGDLAAARALRSESGEALPELAGFLDALDAQAAARYRAAARGLAGRVTWTGRLEHDELCDLLPFADAMAVPSVRPEAFGMVAAEAAACGALPVVARHSGLAEVADALAAAVPPQARPWLTVEVGAGTVHELAAALTGWLVAPAGVRRATSEAMVAVTRERYGWDGVARTVIAAAQGELEGLPEP